MIETYEEAKKEMYERINAIPEIKAVVSDENFSLSIQNVLEFYDIDPSLQTVVEDEVLVVLSLTSPLHELAQNIAEDTELPLETSEGVAGMIEATVLAPIADELEMYGDWLDYESSIPEAHPDTRDRLHLRPEEVANKPVEEESEAPKPLTREELMGSISPKRTMAGDIEAVKNPLPIPGYAKPLTNNEKPEDNPQSTERS